MACGLFLNFEKMAISIVEDEIAKMTDDIVLFCKEGVNEVDEEKFINNLYHGCIAATFIVNLYETTLNTIIWRRLCYNDKKILKFSHTKKLHLICDKFNIKYSEIRESQFYKSLLIIKKTRNDMVHFNYNMIEEGHYISTKTKLLMGISEKTLAEQFTKTYMKKSYKDVIALLELICQKCGLVLYKDCSLIDCDARDSACEFVITKEAYDEREK